MGDRLRLVRTCLASVALGAIGVAAAPLRPAPVLPAVPAPSRALTHPVDVYPSMRVPSHLPLPGGRITCVTCHDFDRSPSGARLRFGTAGAATPSGFCAQCHDATSARTTDVHAVALARAHYDAPEPRHGAARRAAGQRDPESAACMGCHDGTLASGGQFRVGAAGRAGRPRFTNGQHPIGVAQRSRGANDHLIDAHGIDPVIRLFDGRVGCGSCHSPYSERADQLVVSNEGSRLCLSCHDF